MRLIFSLSIFHLTVIPVLALSNLEVSQGVANTFASMIFLIPAILIATGWRGMILAIQAVNQGDHHRQQNLSGNPVDYLDPLGSLACFFFQFGWPTQTDYDTRFFKNSEWSEWRIFISGSLFNLWSALAAWLLILMMQLYGSNIPAYIYSNVYQVLVGIVTMNLMIGIYSFLPLAPLPGYFLILQHLPLKMRLKWDHNRSIGTLILMIMLFLGNHYMKAYVMAIVPYTLMFGLIPLILFFILLTLWIPFVDLRIHKLRRRPPSD